MKNLIYNDFSVDKYKTMKIEYGLKPTINSKFM